MSQQLHVHFILHFFLWQRRLSTINKIGSRSWQLVLLCRPKIDFNVIFLSILNESATTCTFYSTFFLWQRRLSTINKINPDCGLLNISGASENTELWVYSLPFFLWNKTLAANASRDAQTSGRQTSEIYLSSMWKGRSSSQWMVVAYINRTRKVFVAMFFFSSYEQHLKSFCNSEDGTV